MKAQLRRPPTGVRPHQSTQPKPLRFRTDGTTATRSIPSSSRMQYDVHSGQVFEEVEVRASKRHYSDWIGEFKTPDLVVRKKRPSNNTTGARSLLDMAKGTVARQMRSLGPHHFTDIPWEIAEQIWNEITEIRSESFHAWRTIAAAYPDQFNRSTYRYLLDIKQLGLPLEDYYKGISSTELKWLTCLRIAPREIPVADVIRIGNIPNLAVLDLSDGRANENSLLPVDERVFKTWSELALLKKGAFKHLRVLMLGWQEDISKWIFKYVDTFPSLCHILVTDSPKIHQRNRSYWETEAAAYGWLARSAKQSAKGLRPLLDDKTFYAGAVSGCYYHSQELYERLATTSEEKPAGDDNNNSPVTATRPLPVLECWLGSPRIWTHVVEEYPGTRTVWFDNVKVKSTTPIQEVQFQNVPTTTAPTNSPHGNHHQQNNPKRARGPEEPPLTNEEEAEQQQQQQQQLYRSPLWHRTIAKQPQRKKTRAGLSSNGKSRGAADLLAEFGHI